MTPLNEFIVSRFYGLPSLAVIVEECVVALHEGVLEGHLLWQESLAEVRHSARVDSARHDAVQGDVLFELEYGPHSLDPLMACRLSSAVLWECCTRVDANHAACDDDLPSFSLRIVAHEVSCKRGTVYNSLEVDVGATQIRLGGQILDGYIAAVKIVHRLTVDATSVGDNDVKTFPLDPDLSKKIFLRRERPHVAVYEHGRPS